MNRPNPALALVAMASFLSAPLRPAMRPYALREPPKGIPRAERERRKAKKKAAARSRRRNRK